MNGLYAARLPQEPKPARTKPVFTEEARQALIEHSRMMKEVRRFQAENRERIDAEYAAMTSPPRTIEGHVAAVRDGDPERWAELNAEWCRGRELEVRHG